MYIFIYISPFSARCSHFMLCNLVKIVGKVVYQEINYFAHCFYSASADVQVCVGFPIRTLKYLSFQVDVFHIQPFEDLKFFFFFWKNAEELVFG